MTRHEDAPAVPTIRTPRSRWRSMETLVDAARRILVRHPGPALPLTDLHRRIAEERGGPAPERSFLLRRLRSRPDLFRILQPQRGPWRRLGRPGDDPLPPDYRRILEAEAVSIERWVLHRPGEEAPAAAGPVPRLRASLLCLSRAVDGGSATALCRWLRLLREDRLLRDRIAGA